MAVEKATAADLASVLGWLEREYDEDGGEGFWCNRGIIRQSYDDGDLWVVRQEGQAVAFQVGDYSPVIVSVRKDSRRLGHGSNLFKAALARAYRDDLNVLQGECSPRSSLPFWQKLGFERYGDTSDWSRINIRRVLQRELDVPANLPRATIVISFFPENAIYDNSSQTPFVTHKLEGGVRSDGFILLPRRVICPVVDEPNGRDLVVKVELGAARLCFCKAKYDEALRVGVKRDNMGAAFYIDAIHP